MPPSVANATPMAAVRSTRRAHESHVRDSDVRCAILSFARRSKEIVLGLEGAGVSSFLLFARIGHPPRREEGLPTFTLEKLVPGGIAEVSP